MGILRIAGNHIDITGPLDFGHLQIVYQGEGIAQELEVQAPIVQWEEMGDFAFPPVQPHANNTPHFEEIENYRILTIDTGVRDADSIWDLLRSIHSEFENTSPNYEYTLGQNSNSYAATLLWMVGFDVTEYIDYLELADGIDSFPGVSRNILTDGYANGFPISTQINFDLTITATDSDDILRSGTGEDILSGTAGNDTLNGGGGNDELYGGADDDILQGGEDDDLLVGGEGDDVLDGGDGFDIADYSEETDIDQTNRSIGISANVDVLGAGVVADGFGGTDTLVGIETIVGTSFDDHFQITGVLSSFGEDGGFIEIQDRYNGLNEVDGDILDLSGLSSQYPVTVFLPMADEVGAVFSNPPPEYVTTGSGAIIFDGIEKIVGTGYDDAFIVEEFYQSIAADGGGNGSNGDTLDFSSLENIDPALLEDGKFLIEEDVFVSNKIFIGASEEDSSVFTNFENIIGTQGDDVFVFDGENKLVGGAGDDDFHVYNVEGEGPTIVWGGEGQDTYLYSGFALHVRIPNLTEENFANFELSDLGLDDSIDWDAVGVVVLNADDADYNYVTADPIFEGEPWDYEYEYHILTHPAGVLNTLVSHNHPDYGLINITDNSGWSALSFTYDVVFPGGEIFEMQFVAGHSGELPPWPEWGTEQVLADNLPIFFEDYALLSLLGAKLVDGGIEHLAGDSGFSVNLSDETAENYDGTSSGVDLVSYASSSSAVAVDLGSNVATGGYAEGDHYIGINNVTASVYNDVVTGSSSDNVLRGKDGNDSLSGLSGNDWLVGGAGNDIIAGGVGGDDLSGGLGADIFKFNLGDGLDTITDFEDGIDLIDFTQTSIEFGDLEIVQNGANTTITYTVDGTGAAIDQITLSDVGVELVNEDDFIFAQVINSAPIASGAVDLGVMDEDTVQVIAAADLLSLATDADGDLLTVLSVSVDPSIGVITQKSPDTWSLTPNPDFVGSDVEIAYFVSDGVAQTEATATIDVQNVNDAPIGTISIVGDLHYGETVSADTSSLNDVDGLGAFSYQWQASSDGGTSWEDISGETTSTLTIGVFQVDQLIRVRVDYTDALGTSESVASDGDVATGDPSTVGQTFDGGSGADTIVGTAGNDTVMARAGDDIIVAGDGDDVINAGVGNDIVFGGLGDDEILGRAGADDIDGGAGNDFINAGRGNDTVLGGDGDDEILGKRGSDHIDGGAGNDTIESGRDNDIVVGGIGEDIISTGNGDDIIVFDFGDGVDTVTDFKDGDDLIDFSQTDLEFADLTIAQNGSDTTVTYTTDGTGNPVDQITLTGVDVADIGSDDFIFA